MKQDPNEQTHHTFGSSPAAVRLRKEIEKPDSHYGSAIRILHAAERRLNEISASNLGRKHFWFLLLRREIILRLANCRADLVIKSLCRNVFAAHMKAAMRENKQVESQQGNL